jgi:hypothetical protein
MADVTDGEYAGTTYSGFDIRTKWTGIFGI